MTTRPQSSNALATTTALSFCPHLGTENGPRISVTLNILGKKKEDIQMSWLFFFLPVFFFGGGCTHFTLKKMWTQHCFILTVFTITFILFYKVSTSLDCYVYKSRRICIFFRMDFCEGTGALILLDCPFSIVFVFFSFLIFWPHS